MADFLSFTGKFRAQNPNGSHAPAATKVVKRPRLVCNQCQRSKLRCDRAHPCSNCVRRNEGSICSYDRGDSSRPEGGRNFAAEDRLAHLESMVKELMESQRTAQSSVGSEKKVTRPGEFVQKPPRAQEISHENTNNTRYVGSTHWSAILEDINELRTVLDEPGYTKYAEYAAVSEAPTTEKEVIFGSSTNYSLQEIISQDMPSRIEADRLIATYFQGETYIVLFVHAQQFQRQYRDFWKDTSNVNPLWLSMLFSICYMATLIAGASSPTESAKDELARKSLNLHSAAGKCLVVGEYHRPQKYAVEALATYAYGKVLRTLDPSREAGAMLGQVIRMAYEMGFHRDPDYFGNLSPFEGEMRRRFWAACKQMDVMISFQLGLPSSICVENCDTKSPRLILDSDFDVDTVVLPQPRSEEEPNKLLWFIVKERLMVSFGKVCKDALSFKEKTEVEIQELDREIRETQSTIPAVLRIRPLSESLADPPFLIMTRLYVDFIHLKSLCILHRKYMARGNASSTKICTEAGTKLVGQFIEMYKEFSPGYQLHAERWMLTSFTMNDFLLGVMIICLVLHTHCRKCSQISASNLGTKTSILDLLKQSQLICAEKSIASKDAERVSHAIRLTLAATSSFEASSRPGLHVAPLASRSSSVPSSISDAQVFESDPLVLPPWYGYIQGDVANDWNSDPFSANFLGIDLEHMDWGAYNQQLQHSLETG